MLKKSLGQHLLVSEEILENIAQVIAPKVNDLVLEIGPGSGRLTKHIAKKSCQVIAIEKDGEMIRRMETTLKDFDNIRIIHDDFLKVDLSKIIKNKDRLSVRICGNIPYNISTPILFKLKNDRSFFETAVLTIQREVANRLVARPGIRDYGILSIMMQISVNIEKCFDVPPEAFVPSPKVFSSVVKLTFPEKEPYNVADTSKFERLVKKTFTMRRKMIKNCLPKECWAALAQAGIDPTVRPERISIEEFIKLTTLIF